MHAPAGFGFVAIEKLSTGLTVPAICAAAGLSDTALHLLADAPGGRAFIERLAEEEAFHDAVAFLAHALPRREGVWWAWQCARDAVAKPPPAGVLASLYATRSWLDEPSDAHRRAALRAAEAVGLASPAGLAGLAAFLCGESHAPPAATRAPPPLAAAKAIAGCVYLTAGADHDDPDVGTRYADHIRRGLELADRIELWSPPDARAKGD